MLRAQFFNDDRSLPRKDKTKLMWKRTNGVEFFADSNEAKRVLSGVDEESHIWHLQERTFAGHTWPIKHFDWFAICSNGQVT